MSGHNSLPDYRLDPPDDPPEGPCPDCGQDTSNGERGVGFTRCDSCAAGCDFCGETGPKIDGSKLCSRCYPTREMTEEQAAAWFKQNV